MSRTLPNKSKLKFDQDSKACWSFCFQLKVFISLWTCLRTLFHLLESWFLHFEPLFSFLWFWGKSLILSMFLFLFSIFFFISLLWCLFVFLFLYFYFWISVAHFEWSHRHSWICSQIFIGTQMLCCLNSCKPKFNSNFVLGHLNAFEAGVQCSFTFAPEVPFVTFHLMHIWCLILDAPVSTLISVHSRLVFTDLSMRARGAFCHFSIWCIFNTTCGCPLSFGITITTTGITTIITIIIIVITIRGCS